MSRWSILLLGPFIALGIYACGGSQAPASGASDETCPVAKEGSPPTCPEGCVWNGTACKKDRGVIIDYLLDGGSPTPPK